MANERMRQSWTDGAAGWVDNRALLDAVYRPFSDAVLGRAALEPGHRVLDVGCGTGSLLAAAAAVGARPVGVDISPGMTQAARALVPDASVLTADAQTADLLAEAPGSPFDRVVSRFGVMFFADPAAAFANLARASAPEARMSFVCWRTAEENPVFSLGSTVLSDRLVPPPEPPAAGEPGPTAFADHARLLTVLAEGGWGSVRADPLDVLLDYGFDGSDGVENRLTAVLSTTTGRTARDQLEPGLGPAGWADLLDEVRGAIRGALHDGSVRVPAACWLVRASRSGVRR